MSRLTSLPSTLHVTYVAQQPKLTAFNDPRYRTHYSSCRNLHQDKQPKLASLLIQVRVSLDVMSSCLTRSSIVVPFAPSSPYVPISQPKIIAPASTLRFVDKLNQHGSLENENENGIPQGTHWADITEPNTMLVIEQPLHQTCAAVGGIMATRMKVRGLSGCIVSGRVRDLGELKKSGLSVSVKPCHLHLPQIPQRHFTYLFFLLLFNEQQQISVLITDKPLLTLSIDLGFWSIHCWIWCRV